MIPSADRDYVSSLARGLHVLQAFSEKQRRMSIADLSYRTGISRAAVRATSSEVPDSMHAWFTDPVMT